VGVSYQELAGRRFENYSFTNTDCSTESEKTVSSSGHFFTEHATFQHGNANRGEIAE